MELREQFPVMTDVQQFERVGFSREQIARLFSVKALYQRGVYHEDTSEHKQATGVYPLALPPRSPAKLIRGRHTLTKRLLS